MFAVEVRSEGDYGPKADQAIEAKQPTTSRPERNSSGDVDILSDDVVKSYRADVPDTPVIYRKGEIADAEPALPGRRMPVNEMFE